MVDLSKRTTRKSKRKKIPHDCILSDQKLPFLTPSVPGSHVSTRRGPNSGWRGRVLPLPVQAAARPGRGPDGVDDPDASLLLRVIFFASPAAVGDRRGDCHVQWVQDPDLPKALTRPQGKPIRRPGNKAGGGWGGAFGSSLRSGSEIGPEERKGRAHQEFGLLLPEP